MKKKTKVRKESHAIKLPDGRVQTWPTPIAYAIWLAVPGTQWTFNHFRQ